MTIVTRVSAKQYFETGDKPTQAQFGDFIDSALFYEDTSDFGRSLVSASAAASARTLLGAGTLGNLLFTTITTASGQSQLGINGINSPGTLGNIILADNTTASAQNHLGGGAVGKILFESTTTASATNQLGLNISGSLVKSTFAVSNSGFSGTTQIPTDYTIPQNTEGDQYITVSHTPLNASNILEIACDGYVTANGVTSVTIALFQDSEANALCGVTVTIPSNGYVYPICLRFKMTAGATSSTTFKIRAGCNTANTLYVNRGASAQLLGGVEQLILSVKEYSI